MNVSPDLQGKTAVVTGAGRGIGKAIAAGLGRLGAKVVCMARTRAQIEAVADEIRHAGGQALALPTDVSDYDSVAGAFAQAHEAFGAIHILVINAGGPLERAPIESSDPQLWAGTLQLNLTGAYYCLKAAIPFMKKQGGNIIILGSGRGHRPKASTSAYSTAKAGLWMLTRIAAEELNPYRINVNELIPGPVDTEGFREALDGVDLSSTFPASEWIKQPEDVLPMLFFLAASPYPGPTGQCFSLMRRDSL